MRNYWVKIVLGALGVFAAGMIVLTIGRAVFNSAKGVAHSASPIAIPLPFVPFQLDGERLGTFQRIIVRRKSPHRVAGIDLVVKLDDPKGAERLAGCSLRAETRPVDAGGHVFTLHDARFSCLREATPAVEQVGLVRLNPGDVALPLVVDTSVAAKLRKEGTGDQAAAAADSIAEMAQQKADSLEEAAGLAADSVEAAHH